MKQIILITGASRGIGAATALRAAAAGYTVCINYLSNHAAAEKVATTINNQGGQAFTFPADVSKEAEVIQLFKSIDKQLGPITALVNNVGIVAPTMRLTEMNATRLNKMFTTNITSYFLCAREAVKRMSTEQGGLGGAIVNVSSAAARLGSANQYLDYAASKGAIDTFTIGLAQEVAAEGVRVNGVRPGYIYTDIHAQSGDPDRVKHLAHTLPMQRGGQPEEVAAAILWLLSPEASYVTGSFIEVSGGR